MSCYDCNSVVNTNPPYANLEDVKDLLDRICNESCVGSVAPGTLPVNFCTLAFNDAPDPCCQSLFVIEGENLWSSIDCSQWFLIGGTTYSEFQIEELLVSETKNTPFPSFIVDNIPQDGDELIIKLRSRTHQSIIKSDVLIKFNNDIAGGNYLGEYLITGNSVATPSGNLPQAIAPMTFDTIGDGIFSFCEIKILNYTSTTEVKTATSEGSYFDNSIADYYGFFGHQHWNSAAAIEKVELNGQFAAGSTWEVYVKKDKKILLII